jgi:hypothetical protein
VIDRGTTDPLSGHTGDRVKHHSRRPAGIGPTADLPHCLSHSCLTVARTAQDTHRHCQSPSLGTQITLTLKLSEWIVASSRPWVLEPAPWRSRTSRSSAPELELLPMAKALMINILRPSARLARFLLKVPVMARQPIFGSLLRRAPSGREVTRSRAPWRCTRTALALSRLLLVLVLTGWQVASVQPSRLLLATASPSGVTCCCIGECHCTGDCCNHGPGADRRDPRPSLRGGTEPGIGSSRSCGAMTAPTTRRHDHHDPVPVTAPVSLLPDPSRWHVARVGDLDLRSTRALPAHAPPRGPPFLRRVVDSV